MCVVYQDKLDGFVRRFLKREKYILHQSIDTFCNSKVTTVNEGNNKVDGQDIDYGFFLLLSGVANTCELVFANLCLSVRPTCLEEMSDLFRWVYHGKKQNIQLNL